MKTSTLLRSFTTAILTCSAALPAAAQPTINDHVFWAHADGKGEIMTTEKGGVVRFWSLADGKLIEKLNGSDVNLPIRSMRYKMQSFRYLESGFKHEYKLVGDSTIWVLQTAGAFTARIAIHKDEKGFWVRNRATHTIALFRVQKGVASIMLINTDSPTDAAGKLVGRMLPTYPRPDVPYSLHFSPKGAWLVDRDLRQIINTQTGRVISFADVAGKDEKFKDDFVFSPDEKLFALGISGYGMKTIETETGKLAGDYPLPKSLRKLRGREVYPAADCKSYIYTGALTSESMSLIVQDAFLVKGGEVIELKE